MPGIDGFELCRRLRAQAALSLTPILFLTRKDDVEERVRGLEAGGDDYLAKPFAPAELVARVRSHLQRLSVLREMPTRDSLTRCFNQRYFKLRLEQEIARARRYRTELALGLFDIDHFKQVNDTHGYPVGDWVLAHLADLVYLVLALDGPGGAVRGRGVRAVARARRRAGGDRHHRAHPRAHRAPPLHRAFGRSSRPRTARPR